jgi:type IV secretory pathway VirB3-like protein
MLIRYLPVLVGLVPIVGINLAYWIGVDHGNLPSCFPYFDGCTSISATGRYPPGDRLFRAVMLPQAVLLAATWYLTLLWLRATRPASRAPVTVLAAGLIGALALIVYVTYLASNDPFYEIMRRYGIYFYFVGTVVAQIATTVAMERSGLRTALGWLLVTPFVLGLYNFFQKAFLGDSGTIENTIEWIVSLLMQFWFIGLYVAWRKSRFEIIAKTG